MKQHSYFDFSGPFLKGYDRFNHLASVGLDYYWRRKTAHKVAKYLTQQNWTGPVLDLACGTGDMAAAVHSRIAGALIFGSDPSADMLTMALQKKRRSNWNRFFPIRAVNQLPFYDGSLPAITCGFGVRNFVHLRQDMQECMRVLQSGGRIYLLDFYKPQNRFADALLHIYKKLAAPLIGVMLTGQIKPYRYLMTSMYGFRTPDEMMGLLIEIAMRPVEIHSFFFGLVHLVVAEKV
jgi:demethylmenaquinone methyltransferase / 2-methoxy-6-polyprenyl-1,4-benzoquinol methylase